MKLSLLAACGLGAALLAPVASSAAVPDYVSKAISDASRPADERKLDDVRKPGEIIAFAGVKPGQSVAEYLPGGGYYTRTLSEVAGPKGKVYALETSTWGKDNIEGTKKAIAGLKNVALDISPLGQFNLPVNVDVFWTTDNYHDLHVPKYANVDITAFNKHVFESLKSGGTYIIVDHAAAEGSGARDSPTLHRIEKRTVVDEVTAAGFKLVSESDALHNTSDNHTKKVFDLHYKTDQFILKFRKP
ncbi:MAG: class I SAM-dependent methyltransferase [Alphaproteobacteria bacterium]|nr:class I SAM-dependent methyltransferase [Alphaproteobacteria bacterium]